jgi:hypothetical protein
VQRLIGLATALVAALILVPSSAQAFTSSPLWKCRASALYVSIAGNNRVEPIVANGNASTSGNKSPDRAQCASEEAGADNLATPLGIPSTIIAAQSASAKTTITPELGLAIDQKVEATSRVEKLALPLGGTSVVLGVGAANVTATGSCVNGVPKLDATSSMLDLTLGGTPISLNQLLAGLQQALQPLGVLVDVKFNEQIKDAKSIIARAAHIKLLGANQATPLADIVIAESKIDTEQFTCDPDHQIPGIDKQICPTGSKYDPMTGRCIITVTGANGSTQIIVVGRPYQGPSGGTVIPLAEAIKKYGNKLCLRGPGPKYAVIGTNKTDRITGTNGKDRILSLGGNDSVDGGRGDDCLDGGSGSDRMTGGIGLDRMIGDTGNDTLRGDLNNDVITGGSGNDKIAGGAGKDRIYGNAGNDILSGNYGSDLVDAGAGNDIINIAQQGPAATAKCGSGNDIIRLNNKERRKTSGCEKSYVLKDR